MREGRVLFLFLMLQLHLTAAVSEQRFTVRSESDVTLACGNATDDQKTCRNTWMYSKPFLNTVTVFESGEIHSKVMSRSDRLSVTGNCSLVIKNVTAEDAGRYYCRQINKSGQQQGPDFLVELFVVTVTQHQGKPDNVALNCTVWTHEVCKHTVKWLYSNTVIDKHNKDMKTSQSTCSASVTFKASHYVIQKKSELLKCEVTDTSGNMQVFTIRPQSTTKSTKMDPTPPTADLVPLEVEWWHVALPVVVAALVVLVVFVMWITRKGKKTQMDDKTELSLNPAETKSGSKPSLDVADPEGGVSYASISFPRNTGSKAQVHSDDAVTYSTVKSSSTDPSSLYTTIN